MKIGIQELLNKSQYLVLGEEPSMLHLTLYLMLFERRVQQQETQKQRLSILKFNHSFKKKKSPPKHSN